jgi:hypothetical protein
MIAPRAIEFRADMRIAAVLHERELIWSRFSARPPRIRS